MPYATTWATSARLSDVVAPPYDVIDAELQEQLYQKHPCNVVRLILNRIEPGDDDEVNNRYTRAKRLLKDWRSAGVLFAESDPAIYVYDQEFSLRGRTATRGGGSWPGCGCRGSARARSFRTRRRSPGRRSIGSC